MGVIVNAVAIAVGGVLGCLFEKFINKDLSKGLELIIGVMVVLIAIGGYLSNTVTIVDSKIEISGTLLILFSLVIGYIIGHFLKLNDKVEKISLNIEEKIKFDGFAKGFLPASILFCSGAMAILGSIASGLGDNSILYAKAILDGVSAIIFASTLGGGVIFSAILVFLYQGLIFLFATKISLFITPTLLSNFSAVGFVIILLIGLNVMKITKIKVVDTLPALLIPILYALIF